MIYYSGHKADYAKRSHFFNTNLFGVSYVAYTAPKEIFTAGEILIGIKIDTIDTVTISQSTVGLVTATNDSVINISRSAEAITIK